jgi:hypothetical protein
VKPGRDLGSYQSVKPARTTEHEFSHFCRFGGALPGVQDLGSASGSLLVALKSEIPW